MILKPRLAVLLWTLSFALCVLTVATQSLLFWLSLAVFAAVSLHICRHRRYYDHALDDDDSDPWEGGCL